LRHRTTPPASISPRFLTAQTGLAFWRGGTPNTFAFTKIENRILLKKFVLTNNRAFDGIFDHIHSNKFGDFGPLDHGDGLHNALPGAKRRDDGHRTAPLQLYTSKLQFSPTSREWAAISPQGLHIYSLDDDMIFDPIFLSDKITPKAVHTALTRKEYGLALRYALQLNEFQLLHSAVDTVPYNNVPSVVRSVHAHHYESFLFHLSKILDSTPHIDFYLHWTLSFLQCHGAALHRRRTKYVRAFRALMRSLNRKKDLVDKLWTENVFWLDFVDEIGSQSLFASPQGQIEQHDIAAIAEELLHVK